MRVPDPCPVPVSPCYRAADVSDAQSSQDAGSLARFALDVERVLDGFAMRLALSVAIIVSLLPLEWAAQLDPLFLLLFGSEFLVRLFVVLTAPPRGAADTDLTGERISSGIGESRSSRAGAVTLLVIDFIALLSFFPFTRNPQAARWLRLFRLTRMLLLVGYWAPLVRDLWSIMARRERARQIVLMAVTVGGLSFAGAVVLHHLGESSIDANGDGAIDAGDRQFANLLWWAFRQVQDPGNLLESPHAIPVLFTSMLLTLFGLFLVSFLIGLGTDVVSELLELSRLRPAGLRGHTVVVGVNPSTERLLSELMRYYRTLSPAEARPLTLGWWRDVAQRIFRRARYLVVGREEEPPVMLRHPDLAGIVYRQHAEQDHVLIARADLLSARRVLLLADPDEDDPDVETIQTLLTLVERIDAIPEHRLALPWKDRHRVIIAEILQESHVPAARAALRGGRARLRAFVVPTERVLAMFVAGVVQRPGLGGLLEELLTHSGHEIYTCFFRSEGLGFRLDAPPVLPADSTVALERMVRRGLDRGDASTVVPLGLLIMPAGATDPGDFEVVFNPGSREPSPLTAGQEVIGFVAVGDTFAAIREFAEDLVDHPVEPGDEPDPPWAGDPVDVKLERAPQTCLDRVLICGFRPSTIYMLEQLMEGQAGADVLVLLRTDSEREAAVAALESHSALVERRLLPLRHASAFHARDDGSFTLQAGPEAAEPSRVRFAVADWVASRSLVDLPEGFGHVASLDAVVFIADEHSDARTTTALLKLEALLAAAGAEPGRPRVVAEVGDGRLAARLQDHCKKADKHHIRIYSVQQLRAFFLFQSVVVPGFDVVYSELLGNWGQSFVRLRPAKPATGRCTFPQLALSLWREGMLLLAVEFLRDDGRGTLHVAPARGEPGAEIDLSRLRSVWVIAPDRESPVRARRPALRAAPATEASA